MAKPKPQDKKTYKNENTNNEIVQTPNDIVLSTAVSVRALYPWELDHAQHPKFAKFKKGDN